MSASAQVNHTSLGVRTGINGDAIKGNDHGCSPLWPGVNETGVVMMVVVKAGKYKGFSITFHLIIIALLLLQVTNAELPALLLERGEMQILPP